MQLYVLENKIEFCIFLLPTSCKSTCIICNVLTQDWCVTVEAVLKLVTSQASQKNSEFTVEIVH